MTIIDNNKYMYIFRQLAGNIETLKPFYIKF